jgi:hypothetical protein
MTVSVPMSAPAPERDISRFSGGGQLTANAGRLTNASGSSSINLGYAAPAADVAQPVRPTLAAEAARLRGLSASDSANPSMAIQQGFKDARVSVAVAPAPAPVTGNSLFNVAAACIAPRALISRAKGLIILPLRGRLSNPA